MDLQNALRAVLATPLVLACWSGEPGGSFHGRARAEHASATRQDAAWVDKRIEQWQPTQAERALDAIGWARNLSEARWLAAAHGRPIFLFTYDGADLACYRC